MRSLIKQVSRKYINFQLVLHGIHTPLECTCFWTSRSFSSSILPHFECSTHLDTQIASNGLKIFPNFVSEDEEMSLLKDMEPKWRRLKYQEGHWDNAIRDYRETEGVLWSNVSNSIISRIRSTAFDSCHSQKSLVHVLDLSPSGYIKPHVDSVKFCGRIIAGLSLLSPCVMKFIKQDDIRVWFKTLLKRRSLYVMQDRVRYDFTHEVLSNEESFFKGKHIPKERRISVLCRSEPEQTINTDNIFEPIVIQLDDEE